MRHVGAVLLAAGASTRLGRPKQLVTIGTENLLERSLRVAKEAECCPVVVVLGSSAALIRKSSRLAGAQVVINENWPEGISSSIRVGVEALRNVTGVLLMTSDMPAVTSGHLRALAASGEVTASSYAGRKGVPAYIPESMFPALMQLQGDMGARVLLQAAAAIELAGGELDIDTEKDVSIARQVLSIE